MKDVHFFAEMPEERKSKSASKAYPHHPWTRETLRSFAMGGLHVNVVAVIQGTARLGEINGHKRDVHYDSVSAVYDHENSAVASTGVTDGYLRKRAVRIDEALARKLHPALFASGLL
ncbi:hypothetical protein [Rhizobium wenxiniae]|uniref:hypothetical protein n=1 Tax=Rhizobium wenxiniae TaxID=1737357 RepID=UPI003C244F74